MAQIRAWLSVRSLRVWRTRYLALAGAGTCASVAVSQAGVTWVKVTPLDTPTHYIDAYGDTALGVVAGVAALVGRAVQGATAFGECETSGAGGHLESFEGGECEG